MPYTEDTLVQQTSADYLERKLGWTSVYAYNNEDFGPDSLLGRASDREVVLTRPLREKLMALNPGLPAGLRLCRTADHRDRGFADPDRHQPRQVQPDARRGAGHLPQ